MLEREYGLDLSDWLKEYALYHNKISKPEPQPEEPTTNDILDALLGIGGNANG